MTDKDWFWVGKRNFRGKFLKLFLGIRKRRFFESPQIKNNHHERRKLRNFD